MIEGIQGQNFFTAAQKTQNKTLSYERNERTAGKIAVWDTPKTPKQDTQHRLAAAQQGLEAGAYASNNARLAYQTSGTNAYRPENAFGFGDLLDMVNPMHHVPVVNTMYREATGDDIKPIGKIIGGALFGGPAGVAAGLANTISEAETGKDMAENAMGFVRDGDMPTLKSQTSSPSRISSDVETTLTNALTIAQEIGSTEQRLEIARDRFTGFKREPITTLIK